MTTTVKKILYKLLGLNGYLRTLNTVFLFSYRLGLLKKNPAFNYHYFVQHLINKDDTVVDIGANLGYFSSIFAWLTQSGGKLVAIEPVKPFFDVLKWNLRKYNHCLCHNYALGMEDKSITMSIPKNYGYLRTGLAHVARQGDEESESYTFTSKMTRASLLLNNLATIDYIKCDIEGYEEYVLPELRPLILKHLPILQVETWGEHKKPVMKLMKELNFNTYSVLNNILIKNKEGEIEELGDYIFIHASKEEHVLNKLKKQGLYL